MYFLNQIMRWWEFLTCLYKISLLNHIQSHTIQSWRTKAELWIRIHFLRIRIQPFFWMRIRDQLKTKFVKNKRMKSFSLLIKQIHWTVSFLVRVAEPSVDSVRSISFCRIHRYHGLKYGFLKFNINSIFTCVDPVWIRIHNTSFRLINLFKYGHR